MPYSRHHRPGDVRGALQVVLRPGRNLAERDLLGRPAAQQHRQLVQQFGPRHQVAILEGQLHRVAERAKSALHDGNLVDRIEAGQGAGDDGVARLVVRDRLPLARAHDPLLFQARNQAVDRLLEIGEADHRLVPAGGQQGRLVDQVGQIGAGEPRRPRGHDLQVHLRGHLHGPRVDPEDVLAPAHVGLVDQHLTIEPAGPEQGRVEHLGAVGGGHDDDALAGVEAVHLRQQLVQRLLALLVAAHRALDAHLAERVEFVDEHDAGRLGLGLREQVAHARGADADEHLDELRPAEAEEGHLGLACDGPRQQGLAGARRADQQDALRDPPAEVRVLLRGLQELDDLAQLVLGLVHAGHVPEADLDVALRVDLRAAARERHDAALGAADAPEEEAPERDQEQQREDPAEQFRQPAVDRLARVLDPGAFEVLDELRDRRSGWWRSADPGWSFAPSVFSVPRIDSIADRDLGHPAVPEERLELAVRDRAARGRQEVGLHERDEQQKPQRVPDRRAGPRRAERTPIAPGAGRRFRCHRCHVWSP